MGLFTYLISGLIPLLNPRVGSAIRRRGGNPSSLLIMWNVVQAAGSVFGEAFVVEEVPNK